MTELAGAFEVLAGGDGYRFGIDDEGRLVQAAFGPAPDAPGARRLPLALPTFGEEPTRDHALRVTHADGDPTTRLAVTDVVAAGAGARIELRDDLHGLGVALCFRSFDRDGVLEQWTEIVNHEPGPVTIHEAASASPALRADDPWLVHHGGGWAAEWTSTAERLTAGTKVLASRGRVRAHLQVQPFFLLRPDGQVAEDEGLVVAGALAWGGDVRFAFEMAGKRRLRLVCGAAPPEVTLAPGEQLVLPSMLWAWSASGVGPLSRRLHRHVRAERVRGGDRPRAVVANNWEATFFSFDQPKILGLIDDAADLGAELFLLDDGWFGESHPRDDDTQGLGDWVVDRAKLPDGIGALADRAAERQIRFGLWVEPEMVNERSALHAEHPDWVVARAGRARREERHQLVLDLTRADVAAFVGDTVDRLLAETPGISYLKWDANRDVSEPPSAAHGFRAVEATWAVMAGIADRHPDVELMLCASGGGRVDLGTLRWFHEVWTSDNTDPVARVRMQWSASQFLPASVLGAHVTRWGGRPLAFTCAVALSARFGFDLDTAALDPDERQVLARATAAYRRIRDVVQDGDLHRLLSPLTGDHGAIAYVADDGGRAVVFAFALTDAAAAPLPLPAVLHEGTWTVERLDLESDDAVTAPFDGTLAWPTAPAPSAAIWVLTATGADATSRATAT